MLEKSGVFKMIESITGILKTSICSVVLQKLLERTKENVYNPDHSVDFLSGLHHNQKTFCPQK